MKTILVLKYESENIDIKKLKKAIDNNNDQYYVDKFGVGKEMPSIIRIEDENGRIICGWNTYEIEGKK